MSGWLACSIYPTARRLSTCRQRRWSVHLAGFHFETILPASTYRALVARSFLAVGRAVSVTRPDRLAPARRRSFSVRVRLRALPRGSGDVGGDDVGGVPV